jgi:hypothetical protein
MSLKKVSGEQNIILNDLNLRSLVYIAMHLNPSTNNKIGHFYTATSALIGGSYLE